MDNIITIRLKEDKETGAHDYKIDFESNPTASDLVAALLILEEVTTHNYNRDLILTKCASIYPRIRDIEEIRRI